MRLIVHHSTLYRYDEQAHRVVQALRLWPSTGVSQVVHHWRVEIDDHHLQPTCKDGFGNPAATHTVDRPLRSIRVAVTGEVETKDLSGVIGELIEVLPPQFFLNSTALTAADPAIRALAESCKDGQDGEIAFLHRLCGAVSDAIAYIPYQTDAQTLASEALAAGAGVCQDHAHVLIAAARHLSFPARYVSGYLCAEQGAAASHAWAEIYVKSLGWVGFDAANRTCPDDRYVRIAVGRDYSDAAPVRGVRRGGGAESMEVSVSVTSAQQ